MKAAIHALKYDRLHAAARGLGWMLARAIAKLADDAPSEMLVVPVPLHRSKYAERGFNQARSLAVAALESLHTTHPEWRLTLAASTLMRIRATESQFGLTPRQRRLNVKGAFEVSDPAAVTTRHVLLIDDILTTGATVRAAALALAQAGAASVRVATLARAGRVRDSRRVISARLDDAEEIVLSHPRSPQRRRPIVGDPDSRNNNDAARVGHPETMQWASIDSSHEQSSF
jgi:ComF family protein